MASGPSRSRVDQFFAARKRKNPPSLHEEGAGKEQPVAAVEPPRPSGDDTEMRNFKAEFLSLFCSNVPPANHSKENESALQKQLKELSPHSDIFCKNESTLRPDEMPFKDSASSVSVECNGAKGLMAGIGLQKCTITPSSVAKRARVSGDANLTPTLPSRNYISPGDDFWNAAIQLADNLFVPADNEGRQAEDKASCAAAQCLKSLPRVGDGNSDGNKMEGSSSLMQAEKSADIDEMHVIGKDSPLPVKHLDFSHEDANSLWKKLGADEKGKEAALKGDELPISAATAHLGDHERVFTLEREHGPSPNLHEGTPRQKSETDDMLIAYGGTKVEASLIHGGNALLNNNVDSSSLNLEETCSVKSMEQVAIGGSHDKKTGSPVNSAPSKEQVKLSNWLPSELCGIYMKKGISELYSWQVECLLVDGVLERRNLVYCASTSAGKSFVAEILMLRRIMSTKKMALLVLPYVSICAEKAEHLERLLEPLGRHVRSFYGSQGGGVLPKDTSVAVCTIEKANFLINKLLEDGRLGELGIIVIDELHMVGDQHRGYLLELLLTKLRYATGEGSSESSGESPGSSSGKGETGHGLQIVGMSATMPNVGAVADWLDAALYQTDFRPVPLEEYIKVGNTIFDKGMNAVRVISKTADLQGKDPDHIVELCHEVVQLGHSVLVFCSSRKGCESTARHISKFLRSCIMLNGADAEFSDIFSAIEALRRSPGGLDPTLEETLPFGVAYHHAGLTVEEREIVETCYRRGLVRVLTATSTLAAGVNLPARRVIFRQPKVGRDYIDGTRYRQMAGRAGRTGIDTRGESILVCKPSELKRVSGFVNDDCPPLESCLSEDKNGMTHAILEVVAGGIVQTANDIHRYVKCTLLNSTKPFDDVVKSAQDSLRWLCRNKFLEWNEEMKMYSSTPLGRAAFGSSLNPEESLIVLDDLSRAREGFVLASDMHLVYLVTPINVDVEPDWELYYERFMELSLLEQSVGNRVGVVEPFLMRMAHGMPLPGQGRFQKKSSGMHSDSHLHSGGGGTGSLYDEKTLRVSKRFYVALMLSWLVQEAPIADVCESFKVARGMIQALQENAGRFASMVSVFCQRLGWHDLEGLVAKFQNRVSFGVRAEIAELTSIPYVKGSRARALYKAGLRTPLAIAESSVRDIAKALSESSSWALQDNYGVQKMQLGIAKKIKNGARKIVLDNAEEARVAAFTAFKSLGLEVPQFSLPVITSLNEDVSVVDESARSGEIKEEINKTCEPSSKVVDTASDSASEKISAELVSNEVPKSEKTYDVMDYTSTLNAANDINVGNREQLDELHSLSYDSGKEGGSLSKGNASSMDKGPVSACNFPGGLDSFLDHWASLSVFSFDLHFIKRSHNQSLMLFEVVGLAVCWESSPVYYCNFSKDLMSVGSSQSTTWEVYINRWKKISFIMQQRGVRKMTWNLKIQIQALKSPCVSSQRIGRLGLDHLVSNDIKVIDKLFIMLPSISVYDGLDVCLVAWVLWPDEESKAIPNLEKLAKKHLSAEAVAAATRDGRWRNQMQKAAQNGCCRRVAQTRALGSHFQNLLVSQNLLDIVTKVESPLVCVLADMELWGIGVDMDACLHARNILMKKLKELEKETFKLAGMSFSLYSTADIANVLYNHLKLPLPKGCEKGKLHPSTNKHSLDLLREQHPIVPVIKEHRSLAKLLNSTLGSICSRAQLSASSQKYIIHGHWLQASTSTGRLSMEEPNLQCVEHMVILTLPSANTSQEADRHEINPRNFFIPTQENWLFLVADYSQIELRLMAHLSKDPTLIELLCKPDSDVFTMISARWTGKPEASICPQERENTKRLIYGILYGMSANTLAEHLHCSSTEASNKIRSFMNSFPCVSSWINEAISSCRRMGYVETLMGRKRFLSNINLGNNKEKAKAQRQAVNSICQGSAADIIKVAMIKVHSVISSSTCSSNLDCEVCEDVEQFSSLRGHVHMVLQVHDELVLEVDPSFINEAGRLLQYSMESAASLSVPLRIKMKVGSSWGSLEPFQAEKS